jgi:phosphatidylglycerophosphatase C
MNQAVVAAFDVDHTLTTRDCVVPFLRRCRSLPVTLTKMLVQTPDLGRGVIRRDRDLIKQVATRAALAGRPRGEMEDLAARYAHEVAANWLRPDTVERLRWHQAQSHFVVLVSASYELYLRHLGALLGVHAVISTRLVSGGETLTGELDGPNCRGAEKAQRLLTWMTEHVGERAETVVWAYGDSAGDQEMLDLADHAIWVHRSELTPCPTQ